MSQYLPAVPVFNKNADLYRQKYMDVGAYIDGLDAFCNALPPSVARLMDLGCGPGNITKYLLRKNPFFSILGLDAAENMVAIAQQENPEGIFMIKDCTNLSELAIQFDGIVCGFLIPYLDPEQVRNLIKEATNLLVPGGYFYISFTSAPNTVSKQHTGSTGDTLTVHLYSEQDIAYYFLKNDCTIVQRWPHQYINDQGQEVQEASMLVRNAGPQR
jgi:trans-aconitate methyltransferase